MVVDITLKITPKIIADAQGNEKKALLGHLGTHFDIMDKDFPLEYTELKGLVFDVSKVANSEITCEDINLSMIEAGMFIAFYSGFVEHVEYGSKTYFKEHPQLENQLIEALLAKHISIIGVDFAGIRRGVEHTPIDQYCADRNVFIIENLCNLHNVLDGKKYAAFRASTYPMRLTGTTGIPCRVIARL